jgi:hypothetical protein
VATIICRIGQSSFGCNSRHTSLMLWDLSAMSSSSVGMSPVSACGSCAGTSVCSSETCSRHTNGIVPVEIMSPPSGLGGTLRTLSTGGSSGVIPRFVQCAASKGPSSIGPVPCPPRMSGCAKGNTRAAFLPGRGRFCRGGLGPHGGCIGSPGLPHCGTVATTSSARQLPHDDGPPAQ